MPALAERTEKEREDNAGEEWAEATLLALPDADWLLSLVRPLCSSVASLCRAVPLTSNDPTDRLLMSSGEGFHDSSPASKD